MKDKFTIPLWWFIVYAMIPILLGAVCGAIIYRCGDERMYKIGYTDGVQSMYHNECQYEVQSWCSND